ncbi:MAG TPA: HEAT repeat domain-containing protein [Gemmataceae bacterium]|jgi:HEAT repeat protein
MRFILFISLAVLAAGCAKKEPLLSHGQLVSHWLEVLNDPNPQNRKKAVTALGHVGSADPEAIPAVISAVKDPDATVRAEAVLALLNLGPAAKEAVPTLEEARSDRDPKVREYAAKTLERVQGTK